MARPKLAQDEKRKNRMVTLTEFEVAELKNLSLRGELTDGIRIALAEANYLQNKRRLSLDAKRLNNVRQIRD